MSVVNLCVTLDIVNMSYVTHTFTMYADICECCYGILNLFYLNRSVSLPSANNNTRTRKYFAHL